MKNICCCILALLLALPGAAFTAAAEENPMLSLTEVLGIMSEGPDDEFVTRGAFLSLVLRTLKMDYNGYSDTPVFSDLTVGHAYYGAIMFAVKSGIVAGDGNGRFYPDDYITGEQAAIMMVNAMGYQKAAAVEGHLSFAWKLGLMQDAAVGADTPVTQADARMMLLNLLNAPYPKTTYVFGEAVVEEGEDTFLQRVWGLYTATGVVEATELRSMSLTPEHAGYVRIDDARYNCARVQIEAYFGMRVRFFYSEGTDERELYYAYPTGTNTTARYSGRDFVSFSGTEMTFQSGSGGSQTWRLGGQTALLWNNRTVKSEVFEEKAGNGPESFYLVDNDADGVLDAVCMFEPKIYYGGLIDAARFTITDKSHADLKLDDYRHYVIRDAEGERLQMEQLQDTWHYMVYDPEDLDCSILIVAVDLSMEDEVAAVIPEEHTVVLKVGDACEVLPYAKVSIEDFTVGNKYIFYFDTEGRIIDADETAKSGVTAAYLMAAEVGTFDDVRVKILTEANEIYIAPLASKVTLRGADGGTDRLSAAAVYEKLQADGAFRPQLVFIRENSQGAITSMIQVCEDTSKPYHVQEYTKQTDSATRRRRWMSSQQSFENQIQLKSSTKVFVVPDRTLTGQEDAYYQVTTTSIFNNDTTYVLNEYGGVLEDRYTSTPVVVEEGAYAADYFVLECPAETEFSSGSTVYGLVTDIGEYYDEASGQAFKKLTLLNAKTLAEGEEYVVDAAGGAVTDRDGCEVSRGDLIKLTVAGAALKPKNLLVFYDQSEDRYNYVSSFDVGTGASNEIGFRYYADFRVTAGTVLGLENDIALCNTMEKSTEVVQTEYIDYSQCKIVSFPLNQRRYELFDSRYLKTGGRYVAAMSNGLFKLVIYYE